MLIMVALKPYLTLGYIFAKPKNPVKTNQKTHAVYSIPCGDFEKEYLGQSKCHFRQGKIRFSRTCV
jgi:hypothetical protein